MSDNFVFMYMAPSLIIRTTAGSILIVTQHIRTSLYMVHGRPTAVVSLLMSGEQHGSRSQGHCPADMCSPEPQILVTVHHIVLRKSLSDAGGAMEAGHYRMPRIW